MDYSPRYGRFRALLRALRKEAGLSQTALSQKLGKPQTFVSKSELGERRIDFLETMDFCRACGVTVEQLTVRLEHIEPVEQRRKRRSSRKMDSQGRLTG